MPLFGGPKLDNLITEYVDTLPILPKEADTGIKVFDYFNTKNQFTNISLFNNKRFESKISQVARNRTEANGLWYLANQLNLKY
jgi:hypothetical protein